MTNTVVNKEKRQKTAVQMIQGFRAEMRMTDKDWYKFCLRYSNRNITTVIVFFEDMYDEVPYGFNTILRGEMRARVRRCQAKGN